MTRTKLSVNLNKVALLRNARPIGIPSVTRAARICIDAGADGITVHPRPDARHIRHSDVNDLAELLAAEPEVELNIEGNPFPEFMELVRRVKPTQCTLVPDTPEAFTSDHGWDLREHGERLKPIIKELKGLGIRVSLFMDADASQVARARAAGADRVELYTEPYAAAYGDGGAEVVFGRYWRAAAEARRLGLGVNAGHDLNLHNLGKFCTIPGVLEVSIGHALVADALELGLAGAVRAYQNVLSSYAAAGARALSGWEIDWWRGRKVMETFTRTGRTTLKRLPKRGTYEREAVYRILDEGFVCHVGFAVEGRPFVIPTGYARAGDVLYVHGSQASRMLRALAGGVEACVTVTLIDGLVLARSAFHHSVNYRSVVIFGTARLVDDESEKMEALRAFTEHVVPGRWDEVRWPTPDEMKMTTVLRLPLAEVSAKVRTGPPLDDEEDYALPVWAGVVPLRTEASAPVPDPRLPAGIEPPEYAKNYQQRLTRHEQLQ